MKNKLILAYDTDNIISEAKGRLRKMIFMLGVSTAVLVTSILTVISYSAYLPVFILGVALTCVSAYIAARLLKQISYRNYKYSLGRIIKVHKYVKVVSTTKVGGFNMTGPRRYDHYTRTETRLTVFIEENGSIHGYFINDGTEAHAAYYESRGDAMHIWGTRFPVKLEVYEEKWLCPICGAFNSTEQKVCSACQRRILK